MKVRRIIFSFIFFLLCYFSFNFIGAEILQSDSLANINSYINTKNTLIIFDVDKTLIKYKPEYKQAKGCLKNFKLKDFDIKWLFAEPVDKDAIKIIKELQKKYKIIALTKCKKLVNYYKFYQLHLLGLDFSEAFPDIPFYYIIPSKSLNGQAFYDKGIICSGKNAKGPVLERFLEQNNIDPDQIIFVDNSIDNLKSAQEIAKKMNIPFIGIWYTKALV